MGAVAGPTKGDFVMRTLPEPVRARVARGVALLDTRCPGWRDCLYPSALDVSSDARCVLGQLTGSYPTGVRLLFGRDVDPRGPEAAAHGFNVRPDEFPEDWTEDTVRRAYRPLTRAWKAVLA